MPRAALERHELHQLARPADQYVRRNPQAVDVGEVAMRRGVKISCEQLLDGGAAEIAGWQADAVQHQQVDLRTGWTFIAMLAEHLAGTADQQARGNVDRQLVQGVAATTLLGAVR